MQSRAGITHSDNRGCKAATTVSLSHDTEHFVHWVVLVEDYSLCRVYQQISLCITDVKNDCVKHICVCLVAIPVSAHYFLLSRCLFFFHAYGNLLWNTSTDFSLNYSGNWLSEVVHRQNLRATYHTCQFLLCAPYQYLLFGSFETEPHCYHFTSTS